MKIKSTPLKSLAVLTIAAMSFAFLPQSAEANPNSYRQSSKRILVGYDRCGQPIFRYVTQNSRSNKYGHNQNRKSQAPIRKVTQQRAKSQYRY